MAKKYVCTDIYTVQAGDTLYAVSQRYNVDVGLLMRVNRISNPYNLRIGTRLCVPGLAEPLPDVEPDAPQDGADMPMEPAATHVVKEGDTLYMIAKQHKITLEALMRANPDIDPYNLQIGMEIRVPQ